MKPTDEKSGVRQQRAIRFSTARQRWAIRRTDAAEAAVFDVVYTLLGDMAATIGRPGEFNFGDVTTRRAS